VGGEQTSTHWPPQRVLPPGHSQVLALTVPPLPVHAWLAGHWQRQVLVFTTLGAVQVRHWLLHSVWPVGQPQILPFPRGFFMQFLEQHSVFALHLCRSGLHAAQARSGDGGQRGSYQGSAKHLNRPAAREGAGSQSLGQFVEGVLTRSGGTVGTPRRGGAFAV